MASLFLSGLLIGFLGSAIIAIHLLEGSYFTAAMLVVWATLCFRVIWQVQEEELFSRQRHEELRNEIRRLDAVIDICKNVYRRPELQ